MLVFLGLLKVAMKGVEKTGGFDTVSSSDRAHSVERFLFGTFKSSLSLAE